MRFFSFAAFLSASLRPCFAAPPGVTGPNCIANDCLQSINDYHSCLKVALLQEKGLSFGDRLLNIGIATDAGALALLPFGAPIAGAAALVGTALGGLGGTLITGLHPEEVRSRCADERVAIEDSLAGHDYKCRGCSGPVVNEFRANAHRFAAVRERVNSPTRRQLPAESELNPALGRHVKSFFDFASSSTGTRSVTNYTVTPIDRNAFLFSISLNGTGIDLSANSSLSSSNLNSSWSFSSDLDSAISYMSQYASMVDLGHFFDVLSG